MIAASLLFLTYMGLCLIAAYHGWTLNVEGTQKEEMLNAIATKLLGPIGGGIAALTVIVACFTTAITLVAIFAEYLRKDLCREKIHPTVAYVGTLLIATLFANLGFQGIVAFLGPLLQILYPGLILLTLLNLFALQLKPVMVRALVFCAFSCSAIFYFS